MKRKQTNITYTIIDPNTDEAVLKALKKAIIERNCFLYIGMCHSNNTNQSISAMQRKTIVSFAFFHQYSRYGLADEGGRP